MVSKFSKYAEDINATAETALSVSLVVTSILPITSGIVASIDRLICLIQKANSNKALGNFIGERLEYAKSILKEYSNNIDKKFIEGYEKMLKEIEEEINLISGNKQKFKAWILTKKYVNSKEVEEKLMLIYKKLDAANNDLYFSVLNQNIMKIKDVPEGIKQLQKDIPQGIEQLRKAIRILTMNLDIDDWKIDDVLINNKMISELHNQPQVNRGKIVKKKYLTQDVAQKRLENCDCKIINMFKLLADCENVIKFFGIYKLNGDQYLITEWCEHGNLEKYLLQNPELDWNIKVNIATGITNGLVFCHDRDILHHDIRTSNILLNAHLCAKLSNFELSRKETDNTVPGLALVDTARYMAPEKLSNPSHFYTKQCDIFSLGIVLWEIAMQAKPYANLKKKSQIEEFVLKGNHPGPVDENIPIKYKKIMEKAWDHNSNNRPEADKMYKKLSKCLEDDSEIYPVEDKPKDPVSDDSDLAQHNEAKMYKQAVSYHNSRKHEEAWSIFYELASAGHKESLYYLGYYYEHGYAVPQDNKKVLKYYRESADKDCSRAAYHYAEACLKIACEYMEKAAQLGQFKAGIKLAEFNFPQHPSQDTSNKLLRYLDADEIDLQKRKPKELAKYLERIEGLRNKIKQINLK
ncbi:kinase-like domain-containing protein [Glomus cerebriforme]|uniref:Kinase-like domain-containing protein n=1 Tax=Glomus cerebriforme TaxID=658196 RepID=A0A397SQY9_9GLOM|nr:kinase-like domain-containing protein [Glomus cerebriforme]